MATIIKRKNKNGTDNVSIKFYLEGDQKIMSLGSYYTGAKVEEIKLFIEKVIPYVKTGEKIDRVTQCWLDNMNDDLRGRFIQAGLIEPPKEISVSKLFDQFIREPGRKDNTLKSYVSAKNSFSNCFGLNKMVGDVTRDDCLQWKIWLAKEGYVEATVACYIKKCLTIFNWAIEQGFIESNPFKGVPVGSQVNKEREHFVTRSDHAKLLDACPDQDWRMVIALCRIGGLRNPSETLALRWEDVNWEKGVMLVRSSKTEHHSGKGSRLIPLYPELRSELDKQWEQAEPGGSPFVITKWRDTAVNMRTHFQRIIFWAGLQQWERIFHNLRGSRSNELFSEHTAHVAADWMGQSCKVAQQHYLHATDDDFQRAIAPKKEAVPETSSIHDFHVY